MWAVTLNCDDSVCPALVTGSLQLTATTMILPKAPRPILNRRSMIMMTSTGITTEATIATAAVASVRLRISPFRRSMMSGKLTPTTLGELLMSNILFTVNEAATRAPAHATCVYKVSN